MQLTRRVSYQIKYSGYFNSLFTFFLLSLLLLTEGYTIFPLHASSSAPKVSGQSATDQGQYVELQLKSGRNVALFTHCKI